MRNILNAFLRRYPLWISLAVYWSLVWLLLIIGKEKCEGHFIYPLDDTYIHMAVAKHFVNDGFWGVSLNGFSSSSSSPIWTFFIAIIYKWFGIRDSVPLWLNLLFGTIFICYCNRLFKQTNNIRRLVYLLLIILLVPLPTLTLIGMEHIFHALIAVGLIYSAGDYLSKKDRNTNKIILLVFFSGLILLVRYEGIFCIGGIVFLFFIKRRFLVGIVIGLLSFVPMAAYGLYSMAHGWYFLPNSIIMKGVARLATAESLLSFIMNFQIELSANSYAIVLLTSALVLYWLGKQKKTVSPQSGFLVFLFITSFLLHILFARLGWYFRYEAYLVAVGLIISLYMFDILIPHQIFPKRLSLDFALLALIALLVLPLVTRAERAFAIYPYAVKNCYEQMYQLGLFLRKFYSGQTVVAADIGAINYLADIKLIDIAGLGNAEVIAAKKDHNFNKDFVRKMACVNNAQIVAMGRRLFENYIPDEWIEVGQWHITDNVLAGDSTIYFYAPDASLVTNISSNLHKFSNQLPPSVVQSGIYLVNQ